ncbi:hypothetical protein [Nocardioides sp. WS12]|uniref:hypothetical protein n=1 Tax=Nocardioides sp. WS12 TaxID=2486272 RepID=UPI0015F90121|nr:hypothetical protein [Nocardioides sp. WS12]
MVIFGLLLLLLGVAVVLSGLFGIGYDRDEKNPARDTTEILGINVQPEVIFFIGLVAGLLIIGGLWFMKTGAKQGWKRRKEQKKLSKLSSQLDEAELERRKDDLSGREEK